MMAGAWPAVNASLNATSALLLVAGVASIKAKRVGAHAGFMLAACVASAAFFVSYLLYHAQVGSVGYAGEGLSRRVYFTVLISHTVLAVAIVPLVVRVLRMALRRDFERHARLARWTAPLWLYVSVSGIVVYWMLYRAT
jgi:uncharacterized membrane protein YozB (DUF420 family)